MKTQFYVWSALVMILFFRGVEQFVLRSSSKTIDNTSSSLSKNDFNRTHFTWFLTSPWKQSNGFFNDTPPFNNSVDYFGINIKDHISNKSYIESSPMILCQEVRVIFYSKSDRPQRHTNLVLFIYKQNTWTKVWENDNDHAQWQFHQIRINLTDKYEEAQFRFVPITTSLDRPSLGIAMLSISTHDNCSNPSQSKSHRSNLSSNTLVHPFLFAIFGSAFLVIFLSVLFVYLYGIINRQVSRWMRKRSSRRRRKGRKTRNVVRDESTVVIPETETD